MLEGLTFGFDAKTDAGARALGFGRCPVKVLMAQGALVCSVCEGQPVVELVGDFPVCGDAGCAALAQRRTFGVCSD